MLGRVPLVGVGGRIDDRHVLAVDDVGVARRRERQVGEGGDVRLPSRAPLVASLARGHEAIIDHGGLGRDRPARLGGRGGGRAVVVHHLVPRPRDDGAAGAVGRHEDALLSLGVSKIAAFHIHPVKLEETILFSAALMQRTLLDLSNNNWRH